jgi:hypothetical protein
MTLSPTADAEAALSPPGSTGRVDAEVARLRTRSELRIAERSAGVDLGARRDTIKVEARERRRSAPTVAAKAASSGKHAARSSTACGATALAVPSPVRWRRR